MAFGLETRHYIKDALLYLVLAAWRAATFCKVQRRWHTRMYYLPSFATDEQACVLPPPLHTHTHTPRLLRA